MQHWDKEAPRKWKTKFDMRRGAFYPTIITYKNPHYNREKALWSQQFEPPDPSMQPMIRRTRRMVLLIIGPVILLVVVIGFLIWFSCMM